MRRERVTLTRQELEQVRYIAYDYWVELSGGTRVAVDGAKNATSGKVVFHVSSDGLVYMANELQWGAQFPPLILVVKDVDAYLVVMEEHVRLTAYLIAPEYIPSELEVVIGYSEHLTDWGCYRFFCRARSFLPERSCKRTPKGFSSTWERDGEKEYM